MLHYTQIVYFKANKFALRQGGKIYGQEKGHLKIFQKTRQLKPHVNYKMP